MENRDMIYKTLRKYKETLEENGYNVVYIGLYGSQNYNLADNKSDIDARAIIVPTVKQLSNGTLTSNVYDFKEGQVDVKDLVTFVKNLCKGNPAYIESAETEIYIGDKKVRKLIEGFSTKPMAVYGMAMEKFSAIEKGIPKTAPTIEKYGYDTKQLHHIIRLGRLLVDAKENGILKPFEVLNEEDRENLMNVKRGAENNIPPKEYVSTVMLDQFKEDFRELVGNLEYETPDFPNEVYDYIEEAIIEEIISKTKAVGESVIYTMSTHRTFEGEIPKHIRNTLTDEELKKLKGKDVNIVTTNEIEIL